MLARPERFPDLLRERVGPYFEKDGLCFAPVLETTPGGACELAVYFQNRYEGRATASVQMLPPLRSVGIRRSALRAPALTFECPGGAFGAARVAFPIPAALQGRPMRFQVGAEVCYPEDRGTLLRFRAGVPVAATRHAGMFNRLFATIASRAIGLLTRSKPAGVTLTLPQGVAETGRSINRVHAELIWWPELLEAEARALPLRAAA